MAIGFSYTLKPDEAESLKELKSFMGKATELSKFALKIDQTKALEEFESFIQKLQNSEVEVKIKYGEGAGSSGTKVGDAIGNSIVEGAAWGYYTSNSARISRIIHRRFDFEG